LPFAFCLLTLETIHFPLPQLGQWEGPQLLSTSSVEAWSFRGEPAHRIKSPNYVIYTTINDPEVTALLPQVMEGALAQYRKVAPGTSRSTDPMECFIFERRVEWEAFTRANTGNDASIYLQIRRGGYAIRDRYVAYYIGRIQTYSVAAHEGWHQYVARHFKHRPPPFLEEGLACLFEQVKWEGNLPRWDLSANSNRIRGLYNAEQSHTLIPLKKLISMHAGQIVDQSSFTVETFYAQNWAFARFMWDAEDGKYRPALQKLLADAAAGKLYRDGIARDPASTDWDPSSAGPILERYLALPLPAIERAYRNYISKITAGMGSRNGVGGTS